MRPHKIITLQPQYIQTSLWTDPREVLETTSTRTHQRPARGQTEAAHHAARPSLSCMHARVCASPLRTGTQWCVANAGPRPITHRHIS